MCGHRKYPEVSKNGTRIPCSFNLTLIENVYQLSCWRFVWWILWRLLGKLICKLNFSALYQTWKDRMMKSVVNKLGRCFWSQSNCDLISKNQIWEYFLSITTKEQINTDMVKQTQFINQVFPTEILKKILERLDIKSLCSAKQTCKHWKNIIDTFKFLENASSKYLVYRMFHFYFSKLDTFNIYNSKNMHIWPNVGKAKMCLRGGSFFWKIVNKQLKM